ncbi:MAG: hypothetical protein AAF553_01615 [Pseudomonadota bacterium]
MRFWRQIASVALGVTLVAQSASACMVPRDPEYDRRDWTRVEGAYVETRSFDEPRRSTTSFELACIVGEEECSEKVELTFTWTDTWRFGHIVTHDGLRLETYHLTDSVISSCPEPEGPEGSAEGVFFLQANPETGQHYIHDWDVPSSSEEAAE